MASSRTLVFLFVVFELFVVLIAHDERYHGIITYFRKLDDEGNLIDRKSSEYDKDFPKKITSHNPQHTSNLLFKVSPAIVENGGRVTVSWRGVLDAHEEDTIAYYCPVDDIWAHPLDFHTVTVSNTWKRGYGSFTVKLYDMRSVCEFRYFRHLENGTAFLLMRSNEVHFLNGEDTVLHGRLALTGNATQMRIMWTMAKEFQSVIVKYGRTTSLEHNVTTFKVCTYKASDMCEAPANSTGFHDPGYMYDVLIEGLQTNTRYFYSFGTTQVCDVPQEKGTSQDVNVKNQSLSRVYNFTTGLNAGDNTPFKFAVYGDMGITPYPRAVGTVENVMSIMQNDDSLRFVLHNGDISYAQGFAYVWDQFMTIIEPLSTTLPYMVGIGNHEQEHVTGGNAHDPSGAAGDGGFRPKWGNMGYDSGGECGVPMYYRFHMPDDGNYVWWYSFDYGLVHTITISTEHDFRPGSRQYIWLENNLRSVDRTKTPWVIISGHRAMYCSEMYPTNYVVALNMQRLFEDLLYKYKVDLAIWAHYHAYERTCKVYRNTCRDDGITHIVVGSAGMDIDMDVWLPKKWSMFHSNQYGYGMVTMANSTSLLWEWVENESNLTKDHVWIHK